jgi:HEAT repeat protein
MIATSPTARVDVVLFLEGAALVVVLGSILTHLAWRALHVAHRARRVLAARVPVARALAGDAGAQRDALVALQRLAHRERLEVIADFAAVTTAAGGPVMRTLTEAAGIVGEATERARSRHWARRLVGARALTAAGAGPEVMRELLDDPHPAVRAQAAEWAAAHPDDDTIRRLVLQLADGSTGPRFCAQDAVIRLGGRAAGEVARELNRPGERRDDADVALLDVAAAIGDPTTCAAARRFLHASDSRVRAAACRALARGSSTATIDELVPALDDPDADVRAAAARALGLAGHWPAAPLLADALRDQAWDVRRAAGLALRELAAPGLVCLQRALGDPDPFARDMACSMLELRVEH